MTSEGIDELKERGFPLYYGALGGKRLELIRELVPSLAVLAVLSNPNNPNAEDHLNDIRSAARASGQQVDVFRASNEQPSMRHSLSLPDAAPTRC